MVDKKNKIVEVKTTETTRVVRADNSKNYENEKRVEAKNKRQVEENSREKHSFWGIVFGVLFYLVLILLIVWLVISCSAEKKTTNYDVKATFFNIAGVQQKTPVFMSGIKIGEVKSFDLKDDYSVVVDMVIDNKFKVPSDSSLAIFTDGVLGSKYLAVQLGNSDTEFLKGGDQFAFTQDSVDIQAMIARGVNSFMKDKKAETSKCAGSVAATSTGAAATSSSTDKAAAKIKSLKVQAAKDADTIKALRRQIADLKASANTDAAKHTINFRKVSVVPVRVISQSELVDMSAQNNAANSNSGVVVSQNNFNYNYR